MQNNFRIVVNNLNELINNTDFMSVIRKLTLHESSGMNKELDALIQKKNINGIIDAKAIVAFSDQEMLGWALFSREDSSCCWNYKFNSNQGILFQIFVKPELRKTGIASKLLIKAGRLAGSKPLCVIPWNDDAIAFYRKNKNVKLKSLFEHIYL